MALGETGMHPHHGIDRRTATRIGVVSVIGGGIIGGVILGAGINGSGTTSTNNEPSSNPGIVEPGSFSPNPISTPRILYPSDSAAGRFSPSVTPTFESTPSRSESNTGDVLYASKVSGFAFEISYPKNLVPEPKGPLSVQFQIDASNEYKGFMFVDVDPASVDDLDSYFDSYIKGVKDDKTYTDVSGSETITLPNGLEARLVSFGYTDRSGKPANTDFYMMLVNGHIWNIGVQGENLEQLTPVLEREIGTFRPVLETKGDPQFSYFYGYSLVPPKGWTIHPVSSTYGDFELIYKGDMDEALASTGVIGVKRDEIGNIDLQDYVTQIVTAEITNKNGEETDYPAAITLSGTDAATVTSVNNGIVQRIDILVKDGEGYELAFLIKDGNQNMLDKLYPQIEQSFQITQ